MASSEKTSNLQLNNWIGSDRSQREDFNADNEKIDAWAGEVNSQLNDIENTRFKNIFSITRDIQGKNIKLIGDSITAGYGGTGYSLDGETIYGDFKVNLSGHCWGNSLKEYLESNYGCTVKNYGCSNINSEDVVTNLSSLIKSTDDIIICMIGTNNRKLENGIEQLKSDLIEIYNYVKNLGKHIIFMSSIPATLENESKTMYKHKMAEVDEAIFETTSKLNLEYISLYKKYVEYLENKNLILEETLNSDGLHPLDTGYDIMFYLVLNSLGFSTIKSIDLTTNWINLELTNVIEWGSNYTPAYKRDGKTIEVKGVIKGATSFNTINGENFATLPVGFRPKKHEYLLCQGSNMNRWLLTISPNGVLNGSRYGDTSLAASMDGTEWLPFNLTFII